MKNKGFILGLITSTLVLNGCIVSDLGCLFELPENKNELRLMEIIYSDNFSEIQVLRKKIFIGEGTNIPYEFEFNRLYYSFDHVTSFFSNGKMGFMNYGAEKSVFEQPLLISHPEYLDINSRRRTYDYLKSSNTYIFHTLEEYEAKNSFSGDTVSTHQSSLNKYDFNSGSSEVLLSYKPVFLDSSTYKVTRIFDQRFTPDNEIFVVTGDETSSIHYDEEYDHYFGIAESIQMYFLQLDEDLSLDTLFTFPGDGGQFPYLIPYISEHRIIVTFNGNTYEFDKSDRSLKFLYSGSTPQNIAIDDLSLTFDKGTKYYSFIEGEVIDLSDYFDDIKFSIPYKNMVAVQIFSETDKLFVIDLNTKSIVKTITTDELPELSPVTGNSSYRLENPIFTKEGDLIFMYIRQTYLEDVEYEERCG